MSTARNYPTGPGTTRCTRCVEPAAEVDHIIPIAHGGSDAWINLRAVCYACHEHGTSQS